MYMRQFPAWVCMAGDFSIRRPTTHTFKDDAIGIWTRFAESTTTKILSVSNKCVSNKKTKNEKSKNSPFKHTFNQNQQIITLTVAYKLHFFYKGQKI